MTAVDLRRALPGPLLLALPRSRAGLSGRLRAFSAARLAVALALGAQPIPTDAREARQRQRPVIAQHGAAAV
jgi:hypothetical protein